MLTLENGPSAVPAVIETPVTEVRVHGIGGPTPEDLLDDPRPHQITGDAEAGFFVRRWTDPEDIGVPGEVEGYSWRGMNTCSKGKALWILLAPFALANLAGFMVRTADRRRRRVVEGLVRAAQLSLTLYLVIWLSIAAVDEFAYQCGTNEACWRKRPFAWLFSARFVHHSAAGHLLVGGGIVLLALGGLWLMVRSSGRYEDFGKDELVDGDDDREQRFGTPLARLDFWGRPETVRDLRNLHFGAAFALLGGIIGYAALHDVHGHDFAKSAFRTSVMAVIGSAFVLLFLWSWLADRKLGKRWWSRWAGATMLAVGSAVLLVAGALAWTGPKTMTSPMLPGLRWAFVAVVLSQAAVLFLVAVVCAPRTTLAGVAAILTIALAVPGTVQNHVKFKAFCLIFVAIAAVALMCLSPVVNRFVRHRILRMKDKRVDEYRLAPFLMSVLAYVVFYGLASALVGRLAAILGDPLPVGLNKPPPVGKVPIRYWHTDEWNGMVWCIGLAVVAATTAILYGWVLPHYRRNQMPCARVPEDYKVVDPKNVLFKRASKMVCRTGFIICLYDVVAVAGALAVALVAAATVVKYVGNHPVGPPARTASTIVLGGVAAGVVWIIRGSFKDESRRRSLGLAWDLMAFWPRHFHPFAPAVYSERAVPELRKGLIRVTADGRAVVSAHSQGTVLAWCALLQATPETRLQTVLVTHGSPLMKLYATFFPRYFSRDAFRRLANELAPGDPDGRCWTNFYRWTDPIGGALLEQGAPSGGELIVDVRHADPVDLSPDGEPPRIKGHGHYFDDPKVRARIAEIRRHLAADEQMASASRGSGPIREG